MLSEKEIMALQNGSDVRGVAVDGVDGEPVNFLPEAANRIAGGFVKFLAEKLGKKPQELKISVGHDARISASALQKAALQALSAASVHAVECALASTPAMFMSTVFSEVKMDGAIMLTASHLPFHRNGMKFFTADGGLEHDEVTTVLKYAVSVPQKDADVTSVASLDLLSLYAEHLRNVIYLELGATRGSKPFQGMHIIVDAGNGDGGFFVDRVLEPLGANTTGSQFLEPDGMFPNHIPNPENHAAMESLKAAVLRNNADLGLIFDTDVDRMGAVLANGETISRNSLIAMMAAILAPDYPGSTIVTDSVTSDELTEFLEGSLGLKHHRFKRGYKNVIDECIRLNREGIVSPLAIETSGHGALKENYYLDDGAYLAVKMLVAAARAKANGQGLEHLISRLHQPAESKEYRLKILAEEDCRAYAQSVLDNFASQAERDGLQLVKPSYEGVRIAFPHGWALLRMSLHEPNMPLNVESRKAGGCREIAAWTKKKLDSFDKLDLSILDK